MNWIIRQSEATGSKKLGGKAGALAALERLRLPIPPWFAVSTDAYVESAQALRSAKPKSVKPSESVREELAAAMAELCPNDERVAVRSSAGDEDGAQHSFAGQLDSFLFVAPEDVADRVADVWKSGFHERNLAYRREHGLSRSPQPPTVLIQRMVDSDASGVAFSADPVTGERGIAVVGAVFGLGTSLVSGEADADTYSVDRSGIIVKREIANKLSAHHFDPGNPEGVSTIEIDPAKAQQPAVTDDQAREIANLARTTARHFGQPQDIEWAVENGKLYLLQSRPITSISSMADPAGELVIWDNSNIAESYGGVTTPLTFSFARRAYEEVYRQFLRILGVSEDVITAHDGTLKRMLGLIQGRIYYNLISWYRLLALLPGYTLNRRFMEKMMGVKEELPPEALSEIQPSGAGDRFLDILHLCRSLAGLMASQARLSKSASAFYARLDSALNVGPVDMEEMRPDELASHYRDLEQKLLTTWDAPLVNDFFAMIYYGVLSSLVQKWCDDTNGTLQNDLLCGQGGVISAEPAKRVGDLARLASVDPEFVNLLCESEIDQILSAMADQQKFSQEYQAYLDKFSDRCLNELKLESLTLRDDPLLLLRAVGQIARGPSKPDASPSAKDDPSATAEARAFQALGGNPLRRAVFGFVLKNTRGRIRDRENLRFERTGLFGHVRRVFVEIGHRFTSVGVLDRPRDIFYLEVGEILGYIEGTATTADLKGLVSLRQHEYDRYTQMPPPSDRFETRGTVCHGHKFKSTSRASDAPFVTPASGELKGIGCCSGKVRGPVRIVRDPQSAALNHGDILVAERTDPGWIMLFAAASGLLVERGSLLSHSAIVSREMGIPGIVALSGIMEWLNDGDWVEMDGSTGMVRRITQEAVDAK